MFFYPISNLERRETTVEMASKEVDFDRDDGSLETLLFDEDKDEEGQKYRLVSKRSTPWQLAFYGLVLTIYTIAVVAASGRIQHCRPGGSTLYTPARQAVKYDRVTFDGNLDKPTPYRGPPSDELDAAWGELLSHSSIRLTEDALRRMNRTSIKLADGSGEYMGELNVFHHIHCLKYVRDYLHYDYYEPTHQFEAANLLDHIDHCIDDIRQTLMCHADLTVVTYDWIPNYRKPWPNFAVEHECVNWERLAEWAREHSFDGDDQKSLVHPDLGLSFPLVNGKIETAATGDNVHLVYPEHLVPE